MSSQSHYLAHIQCWYTYVQDGNSADKTYQRLCMGSACYCCILYDKYMAYVAHYQICPCHLFCHVSCHSSCCPCHSLCLSFRTCCRMLCLYSLLLGGSGCYSLSPSCDSGTFGCHMFLDDSYICCLETHSMVPGSWLPF